ncbi:Protein F57B10.9 [Aphelenchoides avenae]|nr:Protein F57B10.9 [Aphelenchus avenae]
MSSEAVDCAFADAYAFIEQGLCHDEAGQHEDAKKMYEKAMEIVNETKKLPKADKSELYKGVVNVQSRVEDRLKELKKDKTSKNEKAVAKIREEMESVNDNDAELLYWLPEGVQLVVIEEGTTAAPTTPSSLAIFRLTHDTKKKVASDTG